MLKQIWSFPLNTPVHSVKSWMQKKVTCARDGTEEATGYWHWPQALLTLPKQNVALIPVRTFIMRGACSLRGGARLHPQNSITQTSSQVEWCQSSKSGKKCEFACVSLFMCAKLALIVKK